MRRVCHARLPLLPPCCHVGGGGGVCSRRHLHDGDDSNHHAATVTHAATAHAQTSWPLTHIAAATRSIGPPPPSSTTTTPTAATAAAVASRVFWTHSARHVTTGELKRQHLQARLLDKQSRFEVRAQLRDDGVVSNLYAVHFPVPSSSSSSCTARDSSSSDSSTTQARRRGVTGTTQQAHDASTTSAHAHTGVLYVYELYATRRVAAVPIIASSSDNNNSGSDDDDAAGDGRRRARKTAATSSARALVTERRVDGSRLWRTVRRYLATQLLPMPPLVQLELLLYTPVPLPATVLQLPRVYWDVGWSVAELRFRDRCAYADLPAYELQRVMNKIVHWVAAHSDALRDRPREHAGTTALSTRTLPSFAVVREHTGKLVHIDSGVSADGLRVFCGTLVHAVFVDDTAALPPDKHTRHTTDDVSNSNSNNGSDKVTSSSREGDDGDDEYDVARLLPSRDLASVAVGTTASHAAAAPLRFVVVDYLRTFTYKGKHVDSYRIADASGVYYASHWMPRTQAGLQRGRVYEARAVRVREVAQPTRMRLFELVEGVTTLTACETAATTATTATTGGDAADTTTTAAAAANTTATASATTYSARSGKLPGALALKIDTKGTIASELSLWAEVRQRYGAGPYDSDTQERIANVVEGTPVVVSYSLRQGVVRCVRFGVTECAALPCEAPLMVTSRAATTTTTAAATTTTTGSGGDEGGGDDVDDKAASGATTASATASTEAVRRLTQRGVDEGLLALLPYMDAGQPYALLTNGLLLPLQVLHCCFDPLMRGWQDTAIAALSHLPVRRMRLLAQFHALLARGVRHWGLQLAAQPWRSTAVSLLPSPSKVHASSSSSAPYYYGSSSSSSSTLRQQAGGAPRALRHPPPPPFPTTILVVGVCGSTADASAQQRVMQTVQQLAQYFAVTRVTCVEKEEDVVQYVNDQLLVPVPSTTPTSTTSDEQRSNDNNSSNNSSNTTPHITSPLLPTQQIRDANAALLLVTPTRDTRATRWVAAECLGRGVLPIAVPPASSTRTAALLCGNMRRQISSKFESNPLRGVDVAREVPALAGRRVLVVGVDACHTRAVSVGSIVGILAAPQRNHVLSLFWRHEQRGSEVRDVAAHFHGLLAEAVALYDGLDEVVVLQDGDVFSELNAMKANVLSRVPRCGLTFMCLHKRCNVRFVHDGGNDKDNDNNSSLAGGSARAARYHNVVKGTLIPALTPVHLDCPIVSPSFFLLAHESYMSTARAVQYTVHHVSPTLEVGDVQQLCNVMANVLAPQATKLPMSTRCAHRLADRAERLLDAVPDLRCEYIPHPLRQRLWYL